ncbi:hypothetical protein [Actinotalea solisilvae]|uniref:hypothetical protein n=1 Tax=Actinotalea solisilvae TaxID=2072922 RepID=UPI0035580BB5
MLGEGASPAEENMVLAKVIDRIEVGPDSVRIVSTRGEATLMAKAKCRSELRERDATGRFRRSDQEWPSGTRPFVDASLPGGERLHVAIPT